MAISYGLIELGGDVASVLIVVDLLVWGVCVNCTLQCVEECNWVDTLSRLHDRHNSRKKAGCRSPSGSQKNLWR